MLEAGQPAPQFTSPNQDGKPVSLSDYLGRRNVLLYFYPKDDTPGCTIQANDFTRMADEFAQAGAAVIGVSRDDCDSHRRFVDKFGITIDLLADTEGDLCAAYDVWQEKEKDGVKKMGILRSTFLIDREGRLAYVEYGVDPRGHAEQILERVRGL
jgi:peroxiredoxin